MSKFTRRTLIQSSAAAAALTIVPRMGTYAQGQSPATSTAANQKLRIAGIGVGGRGGAHVDPSLDEDFVAICDIDQNSLKGVLRKAEKTYKDQKVSKPLPKTFSDYRELLEKMASEIDAVFVATPDHHHAPASIAAMKLGKHVYCEKPLTHNIFEARQMMLTARERKVATQMGNQGRAGEGWRALCEVIWAGAIGGVKEAHFWTDRPGIPTHFWWPQGGTRPAGSEPVPEGLNWDAWIGPAPMRPFVSKYKDGKFQGKNVYHPFVWRGWWDFGTGALGDIGCHAMSGAFTALKVEHAAGVTLLRDSGDGNNEMFPASATICWDIPARADMPACKIFWYDGGHYPPRELAELAEGKEYPSNGSIIVGEKGKLSVYGEGPRLMPEEKMKDFKRPEKTLPRCESDHFREWVTACKGGRPAFSNFDHAGPLTEMVLLGNLAIRAGVGKRVAWDGPAMKCTNLPELNRLVQREYRQGWSL